MTNSTETLAVGAPLERHVRSRLADEMQLGDATEFEVWFLPENRDGYSPSVLIDGLGGMDAAQSFVEMHAGTYAGALEIVRTTTRRQRVA